MILLSFDTEEFDVPREHGVDFSLEEGMKVSIEGTNRILDILKTNNVCATFFCTGNFAELAPEVMERIKNEGHEVACHGVDHWQPKPEDVFRSKEIIERVTGVKVAGYRQPRMFPVSDEDIEKAGYLYNSSLILLSYRVDTYTSPLHAHGLCKGRSCRYLPALVLTYVFHSSGCLCTTSQSGSIFV